MRRGRVFGVVLIALAVAATATADPKHWHDGDDKHGKKHDEAS